MGKKRAILLFILLVCNAVPLQADGWFGWFTAPLFGLFRRNVQVPQTTQVHRNFENHSEDSMDGWWKWFRRKFLWITPKDLARYEARMKNQIDKQFIGVNQRSTENFTTLNNQVTSTDAKVTEANEYIDKMHIDFDEKNQELINKHQELKKELGLTFQELIEKDEANNKERLQQVNEFEQKFQKKVDEVQKNVENLEHQIENGLHKKFEDYQKLSKEIDKLYTKQQEDFFHVQAQVNNVSNTIDTINQFSRQTAEKIDILGKELPLVRQNLGYAQQNFNNQKLNFEKLCTEYSDVIKKKHDIIMQLMIGLCKKFDFITKDKDTDLFSEDPNLICESYLSVDDENGISLPSKNVSNDFGMGKISSLLSKQYENIQVFSPEVLKVKSWNNTSSDNIQNMQKFITIMAIAMNYNTSPKIMSPSETKSIGVDEPD